MHEPIINPWIIYLLSVLTSVKYVLCTLAITTGAIGMVAIVAIFLGEESVPRKRLVQLIVVSVCAQLINSFIPNEKTMWTMLIAQYATPENMQGGVAFTAEQMERIINVIVDGINKIKQ